MLNKILLLLMLCAATLLAANGDKYSARLTENIKNTPETKTYTVWIFFTDKGNITAKKDLQLSEYISAKAVKRREKTDNIKPDFYDLPVDAGYIKAVAATGAEIRQVSRWLNGISCRVTPSQLEAVTKLSYVKKADLVGKFKRGTEIQTEELQSPQKSGMFSPDSHAYDYGNSYPQNEIINVPAVHDLGITGEGVLICIMDTGFKLFEHEVFENSSVLAAYDFVNNDYGVANEADSGDGSHGIKVFSTIGGFSEGNLIGPAFGADYILAKTENTDSETPLEEDNWIAAAEWADSIGADLSTTSLGYLTYDAPYESYTWEDMDGATARMTIAADIAVDKGMVVVTSAGNEGWNPDHNTLGAPADGKNVITVGAVDKDREIAGFSSVGPTADGRIKPDFMSMGRYTRVINSNGEHYYEYGSGTSYACPILAGGIALILSEYPELTPAQVYELLLSSADKKDNPDREYGYGIPDILKAIQNADTLLTGVKTEVRPDNFVLNQNYPNPFNPSTTISFSLANRANVNITVYDITGEKVKEIVNGGFAAGSHRVEFNGAGLSSGIYFYSLRYSDNNGKEFSEVKKMTLLK